MSGLFAGCFSSPFVSRSNYLLLLVGTFGNLYSPSVVKELRRHVMLITPASDTIASAICLQVSPNAYSLAVIILDIILSMQGEVKAVQGDFVH